MTPLLEYHPVASPVPQNLPAETPPAEELDRLFALRHGCPHAILGVHP